MKHNASAFQLSSRRFAWYVVVILAVAVFLLLVSARTVAPAAGPLATETLWRLDHVLLGQTKLAPADIYAHRRPPHIFFSQLSDYKGDDGCNAYHGLYRDEGNGRIKFYMTEHTLLACIPANVDGHIVAQPQKPQFLDIILRVTSYEVYPDELRLHYEADESAIMVFYPSNEPYEFFPFGIWRWECVNAPILRQVLRQWCTIIR